MTDVVIIGAGGHGRVVLDILRLGRQFNVVAFLDADAARTNTVVGGVTVLGGVNLLPRLRKQNVKGAIVAIGDNRVRRSYAQQVTQAGFDLISAIHASAVISPAATVGRNVVVAANAVVGTDARVADSAIINTSAVVDHECDVGEAAHICPGTLLAGRVTVGAGAFLGLGSRILPCLKVGDHAVVGAGAVVLADVPPGATVVGVPARIVKSGIVATL